MSPSGKFAAGLLVGALIAGGLSLGRGGSSVVPSPTTEGIVEARTVVEIAPWFEDEEIRFGPTVMLPRGLQTDDATVTFEYELAGLGPSLSAHENDEPQGDVIAVPDRWLLTTVSGTQVEATTDFRSDSVRFEVADPEDPVDTISLVGWRVGVPFGALVELPIEESASATFRGGTVTIKTVLKQTVSTIVHLDIESSGDDWQSSFLLPVSPGWRVSGIQLIWDGGDAPDTLSLEDVSFEWRPVSGDVLVYDRSDQQ